MSALASDKLPTLTENDSTKPAALDLGPLPRELGVFGHKVIVAQDFSGELGATVWDASLVLMRYLENEQIFPVGYFNGKKILELGAGTGVVSCALATAGAHCWATDLPPMLPLLETNAAANSSVVSNRVHIRELRFGDADQLQELLAEASALEPALDGYMCADAPDNADADGEDVEARFARAVHKVLSVESQSATQRNTRFDLVVASDVAAGCYRESREALIATLKDACDPSTLVLIAHELRDREELTFFREIQHYFELRRVPTGSLDPEMQSDDIAIFHAVLKQ